MKRTTNKLLKEAIKYYELALNELKEASKNGKLELAVDGCEKGWLAVVLATNALFLKNGEKKLPKGHRGRRYLLAKHGTKEMERIFYKAQYILHISGFYEQIIDYPEIFECLEEVKTYIEAIGKEVYDGESC